MLNQAKITCQQKANKNFIGYCIIQHNNKLTVIPFHDLAQRPKGSKILFTALPKAPKLSRGEFEQLVLKTV